MTEPQNKQSKNKIAVDYGMTDYYKYYKKHTRKPVSSLRFNKIVGEFNKAIIDLIINDSFEFTPIMLNLTLCVRKYKKVPRIVNGKLINPNLINWKLTNELWEQDSEAKEKKLFIRYTNNHTSKYMFKIKILKGRRWYRNKNYYHFKATRDFQRGLAKRILDENQERFEAYKLY